VPQSPTSELLSIGVWLNESGVLGQMRLGGTPEREVGLSDKCSPERYFDDLCYLTSFRIYTGPVSLTNDKNR
jgi:hypothetical protein